MAFKTKRLVRRNFGTGGIDFFVIEIRKWWFPFWIQIPGIYYEKDNAIEEFRRYINKKKPSKIHEVLFTSPE